MSKIYPPKERDVGDQFLLEKNRERLRKKPTLQAALEKAFEDAAKKKAK